MNVIISNKYKEELDSLEIDISKKLEGEFPVEEIIDNFSNYFFNKMVVDITSIKNYQNFDNLQKLAMNLNVEKIIFLLDHENVNPNFLSELVNVGIYNFTTTKEGIMYLYNNPNSYSDVVQYQNYKALPEQIKQEENNNINNQTKVEEVLPTFKKQYHEPFESTGCKVIGIKNVTNSAGSTTLTYILKNELSHYKDVIAIEVNKRDFIFLRDSELISVDSRELTNTIDSNRDKDIILVDLNSYNDTTMCDDVLYLIEPTTIKLNKLVMLDRKAFENLNKKKIILNKSLLDKKEIMSFEFETGSDVYYNIPYISDKGSNAELLLPLLERLNLLD